MKLTSEEWTHVSKLSNLARIKWQSVANIHVCQKGVILSSHVSLQTSLRATVPFDLTRPTFGHLPEDGNVRGSKRGGNVRLSQTSWILSTLQLLPSGDRGREGCCNIFGGIQNGIFLWQPLWSLSAGSGRVIPPLPSPPLLHPPLPPLQGISFALVPSQALSPAQDSDPSLIVGPNLSDLYCLLWKH